MNKKCPMLKSRYKMVCKVKPEKFQELQETKEGIIRSKVVGSGDYYDVEVAEFMDCVGEECAWWDNSFKRCCFKSVDGDLDKLVAVLTIIRDRMPFKEQFSR